MEEYKESHDDLDMRLTNIHVFDLSFDLSPQDDPCRAWHINTEDGRKYTNGLSLIYDIRVLEGY